MYEQNLLITINLFLFEVLFYMNENFLKTLKINSGWAHGLHGFPSIFVVSHVVMYILNNFFFHRQYPPFPY